MKKYIFSLLVICISVCASAQRTPHALGIHVGGSTIDLEYQYHFSTKHFVQATAGVYDFDAGFLAQGVYNWNIKQWDNWTPKFGTWKLWAGVGAGLGFESDNDEDNRFMLGPVGNLGFGFTLKQCPLSIAVDYRPMIAIVVGHEADILNSGFRNIGLNFIYRF